MSFRKAGIFVCFLHWCIHSDKNSAWHETRVWQEVYAWMAVTAGRTQTKNDWWEKRAPGQVQVRDDEEVATELKRRWIPESRLKKITISKEKGAPVWSDLRYTLWSLSWTLSIGLLRTVRSRTEPMGAGSMQVIPFSGGAKPSLWGDSAIPLTVRLIEISLPEELVFQWGLRFYVAMIKEGDHNYGISPNSQYGWRRDEPSGGACQGIKQMCMSPLHWCT